MRRRVAGSRLLVALLVLVVVAVIAGLAVLGTSAWERLHRSPLDDALHRVPSSSLRVGFTDWSLVRKTLHADLGQKPSDKAIDAFMSKAYDADYSAVSSIEDSALALQHDYGFSPANAQWEAYAQGRQGATMVLKVAAGTDFSILAGNLRSSGYTQPKQDDGVWLGGVDLVANLDPTLSPELQYVVLLKDQGLVVTSDNQAYAALAAGVARGDGKNLADTGRVDGLDDTLGGDTTANAEIWSGDFACSDLAMSQAASDDQSQAQSLVSQAGGVTPLSGLAMAMDTRRTLHVIEAFESGQEARQNLRPRAVLATGPAPGRGGDFSDDFRLTYSATHGSTVLLDLHPRQASGFVLSALYDGPLLFATC